MTRASASDSPCIRSIERAQAQSLVVVWCDEVCAAVIEAINVPRVVQAAAKDYMASPSPSSPYDLGLVWRASSEDDASNDAQNDLRLLARLRHVDCRRLCVVMPAARRRALETLGLRYIGAETIHGGGSDLACLEFNIADYKRVPDWLNNKHWANPERWNKFRW